MKSNDILIIGGNTAGLQAALDLADSGVKVHLIEREAFLGQNGSSAVPQFIQNTRLLEVSRHPNIRVWTNSHVNQCDGELGDFQVELQRFPRYVDLARCTACGDCIEVCPVTIPGGGRKAIYMDGQPGCMAIDKFGEPPCANACPGGIHVQGYVALIAQGRFQEAIDLIREAIPFPGICGRVCTHPCEVNCRRNEIDKPVAVRLLKRFLSDWELEQERIETRERGNTGAANRDGNGIGTLSIQHAKSIAVVGAGPGGMAVADRLARLGYPVTVFEKLPVVGGMMAVGIPSYRLPRDIIAREYQRIQDLGVEIKLNTTIGPDGDHSLEELFAMGYRAVCLAIGAHKSQGLHIPGEELTGVVHGIEVLKTINLSQQLDDPIFDDQLEQILYRGPKTRVAVLGGGNTAMDVSRALRRSGIEDISILYRRTRAEMPAMPEEVDDAEKEGVNIEFLVSPVRVLGNQRNTVSGLECIRMKLGQPDSSGRRRPLPIDGSEFVIDLDLVILAIGQNPDFDFLGSNHQISITLDGRIGVADGNFMTNRPGVFAMGDAVTRDKMVVIEAIGMGKKAAEAIDLYLQGQPAAEINIGSRNIPIAYREMSEDELSPKKRTPVPAIPIEQRVSTYAEVELGYTVEQALREAQRCLACGPCSECQACVQVCKPNAIIQDQQESFVELEIGAIIWAGHAENTIADHDMPEREGIYRIPWDNPLAGSATANIAVTSLRTIQTRSDIADDNGDKLMNGYRPWQIVPARAFSDHPIRHGVFICQCGDQIARYIDTQAMRDQAAAWPGVIHAEVLPFSCTPEGARAIDSAVQAHKLNRIVLAGCSCCSIDQICFSCTFQRVRCKDNLKLFTHPERSSAMGTIDQAAKFVLVNIREQCAWVHPNDRQAATKKATAIVGASVARAMATPTKISGSQTIERSTLMIGGGQAIQPCMEAIKARGISVLQIDHLPDQILRRNGMYAASKNGDSWQASAVVLVPKDARQHEELLSSFGDQYRPMFLSSLRDLNTDLPGVYCLGPDHDPSAAGAATAARLAAWLNHTESWPPLTSMVDTNRCRACGTCMQICEFGAPAIIEENGHHCSWIDPAICTGCGTCVAHCPSGAIMAGYSTDAQIEAMLSVILA